MVMSTQTNVETQQSKQRKYHHNNKSYDNILEMKASTRNNGTDFFSIFPQGMQDYGMTTQRAIIPLDKLLLLFDVR